MRSCLQTEISCVYMDAVKTLFDRECRGTLLCVLLALELAQLSYDNRSSVPF